MSRDITFFGAVSPNRFSHFTHQVPRLCAAPRLGAVVAPRGDGHRRVGWPRAGGEGLDDAGRRQPRAELLSSARCKSRRAGVRRGPVEVLLRGREVVHAEELQVEPAIIKVDGPQALEHVHLPPLGIEYCNYEAQRA